MNPTTKTEEAMEQPPSTTIISASQQRSTANRVPFSFGIKSAVSSIILLAFSMLNFFTTSQYLNNNLNGEKSNNNIEQQMGGSSSVINICPSALKLFANTTKLKESIAKNIHYHQHGGNLESIDRYLNSHMQSSLDRLGLQFFPKDDGKEGSSPSDKPVSDITEHLKAYYKNNKVPRGGYGQPLPGQFSGEMRLIRQTLFENRWINVLEPTTSERFTAGIGPTGPDCSEHITFSKGTYEEKKLCVEKKSDDDDDGDNDDEDSNLKTSCNIVSIGSNDQWGFEEEVMNNPKLRGCVTHTFDCTLTNNMPKHKPQNDNVKFYPFCIGSEGQETPYLPYDQMWKLTKTKEAPNVLKMDVEGFEFDVILNSILSADSSIWPEQIMMEVHWASRMVDLPWMPRTRTAAELALFFGVMFNRGGYIVQHTRFFKGCQPCMEVLMVRAVCY